MLLVILFSENVNQKPQRGTPWMFLLKSFLKMKTEGSIFIIPKIQILGFQQYVSENLPMSNFESFNDW